MLRLSLLDRADPAGRAKVFVWRHVGSARRVTLPSQKGEPARRVILLAKPTFFSQLDGSPRFFNPLNHKIKNLNSHLLSIFISYRSSGEKLIKYQANSFCVIMLVILMTTMFYNALILQGEI